MSVAGRDRRGLVVAGALALGLTLSSCRDASCPTPDMSAVPSLDESEKAALGSYLSTRADLRLPQESECGCDDELSQMRDGDPAYQPYVLRGDFNGDGEEDFAVLLVRESEDGPPAGVLAVFNGPFSTYSPPAPAAVYKARFGKFMALFAKDGQLLLGQFHGAGCVYAANGNGYDENCGDGD
jgi:hypothetical protein